MIADDVVFCNQDDSCDVYGGELDFDEKLEDGDPGNVVRNLMNWTL